MGGGRKLNLSGIGARDAAPPRSGRGDGHRGRAPPRPPPDPPRDAEQQPHRTSSFFCHTFVAAHAVFISRVCVSVLGGAGSIFGHPPAALEASVGREPQGWRGLRPPRTERRDAGGALEGPAGHVGPGVEVRLGRGVRCCCGLALVNRGRFCLVMVTYSRRWTSLRKM